MTEQGGLPGNGGAEAEGNGGAGGPTEGLPQTFRAQTLLEASYSFSGPLPHPGVLEEYERICPGAAERILHMAELQEAHRQSLEAMVLGGQDRRATVGQYIAGVLAVAVVALGFVLVLQGRSVEGFATLIGEAAVLAGAFGFGRLQQRKERETKARQAPVPLQPSPPLPFPE